MQPLHVSTATYTCLDGLASALLACGAVALATASLMTPTLNRRARAQVRFTGYPFTLGVASGCPQPDSVVLWTRLAPEPFTGGGMEPGGWKALGNRARRTLPRHSAER